MKLQNILFIILCLFVKSTTASEFTLGQKADGSMRRLLPIVSKNHDYITLEGENFINEATVCRDIQLVAKIQNYRFRQPMGQVNEFVGSIYFYPVSQGRAFKNDYLKDVLLKLNSNSEDKIIIDDEVGNINLDSSNCARATFVDYCKFAQKDGFEKLSLAILGERYGASNCNDLYVRIKKKKTLDVSHSDMIDFRWALLLPRLKKLDVVSTFSDRSKMLTTSNIKLVGDEYRTTSSATSLEEHLNYISPFNSIILENFKF